MGCRYWDPGHVARDRGAQSFEFSEVEVARNNFIPISIPIPIPIPITTHNFQSKLRT